MAAEVPAALASATRRLLAPLVRILLRNGVPFGVFSSLAKRVYMDVAAADIESSGRRPSVSSIAVVTGLTRKDVSAIWKKGGGAPASPDRYNRAARVLSAWVREETFHDGAGQPAVLPVEGAVASFTELVRRHGGDVTPRSVLDELLRVGAVLRDADGQIELVSRGYVPLGDADEKLVILGTDVADLISAIDHNLGSAPDDAYFQRKVAYDHLVAEALPEIREQLGRDGQSLLEALDRVMADHDRDANPKVEGTGRHRAMVGVYYYEQPYEEDE